MNMRVCKTIKERRGLIESLCRVSLPHIGTYSLDEQVASSRNCENMIGVAQIPLGVAGPLQISSFSTNQELRTTNYYVPLATTEGALIASINRGCKAINESGGALVYRETIGVTRGPVFKTNGIAESVTVKSWIEGHTEALKERAATVSSHLTLSGSDVWMTGDRVYVRFYFDTKDAMGMNMATIATNALTEMIASRTKTTCIAVAGNVDSDKKPAWLNSISGRGKQVWAEVRLPEAVIATVLKTTARRMYDVWLSKCMLGSAIAGSLSFTCHTANSLAALFIATGQDPAHVGEGSLGMTTTEIVRRQETMNRKQIGGEDLYVSVYLPDLMVGTVGGGTGLATQREALALLGIAGGDNGAHAKTLAEIAGGVVLAGEISLLASLSEGTLAEAHKRLGRGGR